MSLRLLHNAALSASPCSPPPPPPLPSSSSSSPPSLCSSIYQQIADSAYRHQTGGAVRIVATMNLRQAISRNLADEILRIGTEATLLVLVSVCYFLPLIGPLIRLLLAGRAAAAARTYGRRSRLRVSGPLMSGASMRSRPPAAFSSCPGSTPSTVSGTFGSTEARAQLLSRPAPIRSR